MKFIFGLVVGLILGVGLNLPRQVPEIEQYPIINKPIEFVVKKPGLYKFGDNHLMLANLSAYDLGPGSIDIPEYLEAGKTSTGRTPIPGRTIAVDPKIIPYGAKVFIPGVGWRRAEDTGGDIKGRKIDILMKSEEEAFKFGRKSALVLWRN